MGNITMSFQIRGILYMWSYDDVSVTLDWRDKLAHFPLVQMDYILDHNSSFLNFSNFSGV